MSGIFGYDANGERVPFEFIPGGGCVLCGRSASHVGIFFPTSDEMLAVVVKLRSHPMRPRSTPCIAYCVCDRCSNRADVGDRIERALVATAAKVVLQ